MAGIMLAAGGAVLILASAAGFIIAFRLLNKKKEKIRDEINQMK